MQYLSFLPLVLARPGRACRCYDYLVEVPLDDQTVSEYPSSIFLLALRDLENLCLLLLQVKGDHADLLSVLNDQDRRVLRGEVETTRLPEDPLHADVAAVEGRVLDVHVNLVLQAIPNLQTRAALHADGI